MKFTIETLNDNGSGMEYTAKEKLLKEISLMIDDCIANGGTFFDVQVDSDASCFSTDEDKEFTKEEIICGLKCLNDKYDGVCSECPFNKTANSCKTTILNAAVEFVEKSAPQGTCRKA